VTESNVFDFLDFTVDEAIEANEELTQRGPRDQRVCLCGHPVSRHMEIMGIVRCKPSKMECSCKKVTPVLEVSDLRVFLRKTDGSGPMHALGRGLAAAVQKEINVKWLVEPECERCKNKGPVSPVAATVSGFIANHDTGYNALLCANCRMDLS
jgi:hypothetical protein